MNSSEGELYIKIVEINMIYNCVGKFSRVPNISLISKNLKLNFRILKDQGC
jgi:hypothetical protein